MYSSLSKYYIIVNSDVEVTKNWILPLIEVLNAQLENGILVINLFKKDYLKEPKKIEINVT